jgi:hypothetical protein
MFVSGSITTKGKRSAADSGVPPVSDTRERNAQQQ